MALIASPSLVFPPVKRGKSRSPSRLIGSTIRQAHGAESSTLSSDRRAKSKHKLTTSGKG